MTIDRRFWDGHPDGSRRVWVHDRWWLATVADPHGEPPVGEHPDDQTTENPPCD